MTGTPASRPPGQRPRHRHPGTAARQAGLPGRLGHEPSLPGTGCPGQGALVLQHAPPRPGLQPESSTSPQTGTMTTRHRARHARCQPRHEPGTPIATVTPSTSTPRRRTLWTLSDDATPAPQGHPQRRGTTGGRQSSQFWAPVPGRDCSLSSLLGGWSRLAAGSGGVLDLRPWPGRGGKTHGGPRRNDMLVLCRLRHHARLDAGTADA